MITKKHRGQGGMLMEFVLRFGSSFFSCPLVDHFFLNLKNESEVLPKKPEYHQFETL
jgi:hypothetical protein